MSIQIEHLTLGFDELRVLDDVTLTVEAGEFVSLIAPSGAGKIDLDQGAVRYFDTGSGQDYGRRSGERRPFHSVQLHATGSSVVAVADVA